MSADVLVLMSACHSSANAMIAAPQNNPSGGGRFGIICSVSFGGVSYGPGHYSEFCFSFAILCEISRRLETDPDEAFSTHELYTGAREMLFKIYSKQIYEELGERSEQAIEPIHSVLTKDWGRNPCQGYISRHRLPKSSLPFGAQNLGLHGNPKNKKVDPRSRVGVTTRLKADQIEKKEEIQRQNQERERSLGRLTDIFTRLAALNGPTAATFQFQ
jgi:hypothetical protein